MLLLYHVRQRFARKILRSLPAIASCCLRLYRLKNLLAYIEAELHGKRNYNGIADLRPAVFIR